MSPSTAVLLKIYRHAHFSYKTTLKGLSFVSATCKSTTQFCSNNNNNNTIIAIIYLVYYQALS